VSEQFPNSFWGSSQTAVAYDEAVNDSLRNKRKITKVLKLRIIVCFTVGWG
jgi:hypothetical protein